MYLLRIGNGEGSWVLRDRGHYRIAGQRTVEMRLYTADTAEGERGRDRGPMGVQSGDGVARRVVQATASGLSSMASYRS